MLNAKGFALASGLLWGLAVFVTTLVAAGRGIGNNLSHISAIFIGYQVTCLANDQSGDGSLPYTASVAKIAMRIIQNVITFRILNCAVPPETFTPCPKKQPPPNVTPR